MLEYFPKIYPDELLYSVLARLRCHLGVIVAQRLMKDAFGRRNVHAGAFLQTELRGLAANIPASHDITPEKLAMETTLLPYVVAYQSQDVQKWAMAALTGDDIEPRAISTRLGMVQGAVRVPPALRYCPICRAEMLRNPGELYWRRDHQLPGVLVCPTHRAPLADSQVVLIHTGWQEYVPADEGNCPPAPTPPVWANRPVVVDLLMDIAKASAALLVVPPPACLLVERGEEIQNDLRARGLGFGPSGIDQRSLREAFMNLFGPIIDILPEAAPDPWLVRITRRHDRTFAPLRHILIRRLIGSRPLAVPSSPVKVDNPFGPGPWPCRNFLSDHFGQPKIIDCELLKSKRGKTTGVFRCSCGYAFSVSGSRSRILDRSPLFDSRLRELVNTGSSLVETARALRLRPVVVLNHASRSGLKTPWEAPPIRERLQSERESKRAAMRAVWDREHAAAPELARTQLQRKIRNVYRWLYQHDRDWLKMRPPVRATPAFPAAHPDWQSIEAETVETLKQKAALLRAQNPPQRITRAALDRAMGRSGRLNRLRHLPLCANALAELLESTEEFQCRRIAWAAEELRRRGQPISLMRLRELTGISGSITPGAKLLMRETAGLSI